MKSMWIFFIFPLCFSLFVLCSFIILIWHEINLCIGWGTVLILVYALMFFIKNNIIRLLVLPIFTFILFFLVSYIVPGQYWDPLSFDQAIVSFFYSIIMTIFVSPILLFSIILRMCFDKSLCVVYSNDDTKEIDNLKTRIEDK
jgi:hypothetical protein